MAGFDIEALKKDLVERAEAAARSAAETVSLDEIGKRVEQMVADAFDGLKKDPEIARKFRPGITTDDEIVGSKYARYGLNIADIEFLHDMQVSLKGQRKVSLDGFYQGPSEELDKAFKAVSDAYYLSEDEVRKIDQRALDNVFPRVRKQSGGLTRENSRAYAQAMRAMDTADSGTGQQLIGAQYVREMWDAARAESRVFQLIDSFEMTDPTAYLPVEVDIPEPLYVGENTSNTSSDYTAVNTGSQRVQVDAKKFVIHQMWSGELEEDSIIPFVPFLRQQATLAIAHYSDALVLNGDTTNAATGNINLVDADPADTKYYLAFDGIRHVGLVDNTANGLDVAGALTINTLRDLRGLMSDTGRLVDWGHPTNMDDLVFVADPQSADRIALLDEVVDAKIIQGNNANLLNGQVGSILGHPVISSMAVPLTNAAGMVSTTGANNIYGQVVAFNARGFKVGWRRRVKVETERLPARDQTRIVYSFRMGFGRFTPTGAASGAEAAAVAYDIAL